MKKKFLALAALGIALAGAAVAQIQIPQVTAMGSSDLMQVIPGGASTTGNVYANVNTLRAWLFGGGNSAHSGTPALTSCGTSPAIATGSSDFAARVTTGTGTPTGCVITFAQPFVATPSCVLVSQTAYATTTPSYTVSTTAVTLTQAATNSAIYNLQCVGLTGG